VEAIFAGIFPRINTFLILTHNTFWFTLNAFTLNDLPGIQVADHNKKGR
jgi:hypothetical protein